jgi:hypothetical protein
MGGGAISVLFYERGAIRMMEEAESIRGLTLDYSKRPSEEAHLTFQDWQTRMACASAVFFVLGCAMGLLELWSN